MKKFIKTVTTIVILFAITVTSFVSGTKVANAKTYSENGTWKRTINGTTWYFDINDYTSGEDKELGVIYIYKGKKAFNSHKDSVRGEYIKVGVNKYKLKYSGGQILFKVNAKTIKLTQKKGKVSGTKLNGTFKLVKRHYS
jgi:heme/copper-type cytochrome/quinol oxidase subunit 2